MSVYLMLLTCVSAAVGVVVVELATGKRDWEQVFHAVYFTSVGVVASYVCMKVCTLLGIS